MEQNQTRFAKLLLKYLNFFFLSGKQNYFFPLLYKVGSHSVTVTSFIGEGVMRRDGSAGLSDTDICRANRINLGVSRPSLSLHLFLLHSVLLDIRGRKQKNLEAELLSLSKTIGVIRNKDKLACKFAKFSFR